MAVYIRLNRTNLECDQCHAEKENFDMIQRKEEDKNEQYFFCKLSCLHLYENKVFAEKVGEENQEDEFC